MMDQIFGSWHEKTHRGRKGYVDDVVRREVERETGCDATRNEIIDTHFRASFVPKMEWATKNHRTHTLNRSLVTMRVSEFIRHVRRRVNDGNSIYWSDAEIIDETNLWIRNLFRQRAEADPSYGLVAIDMLKTDTKIEQVHADVWQYPLPSWV